MTAMARQASLVACFGPARDDSDLIVPTPGPSFVFSLVAGDRPSSDDIGPAPSLDARSDAASPFAFTFTPPPIVPPALVPLTSTFESAIVVEERLSSRTMGAAVKRSNEAPCPHLCERLKKAKIAHRSIRSAGLLGFRPTRPRSVSAGHRPIASTSAWVGSSCSVSSRMAPTEAVWTDDVAAAAWAAPSEDTFRQFESMCLNAEGRRRRALTAPESGSIAASWLIGDDADDADPIPQRLSPESEDSLALVEVLSIESSSGARPRSLSAPASLDAPETMEPLGDARETIEDPAVLKAQLLSVLRTRAQESGGSAAQPGEAALKLRKWVCWNAWTRRRKDLTPPDSPKRRIRILHPLIDTSLLLQDEEEDGPISAFDDDGDSSEDAEGEDDDEDAMIVESAYRLAVDPSGRIGFAVHADADGEEDRPEPSVLFGGPASRRYRQPASSMRDTLPRSLPPTPEASPRLATLDLPSIAVSRTAEAHPVAAKSGYSWTDAALPLTPPTTPPATVTACQA